MKPEENQNELDSPAEGSPSPNPDEVFQAEIVNKDPTPPSNSGPNEAGSADTPETEGNIVFDVVEIVPPTPVGHAGEQLWGKSKAILKPTPKPPFGREVRNARIFFGIAAVFSLALLIWFYVSEFRLGPRKPLGVFRDSLLIIFVLTGNLAGFFRVHRKYVPGDARWLSWIGSLIALACYFGLLPSRWAWVCFGWVVIQLSVVVANAFAPHKSEGDELQFNINDSVAANGGSIAAIILGVWSILGALFTSLSIVNSLLGILLGLWGLSSRKKGLAVLGIVLCVVGTVACMLNITYLFWEMMALEEEELLQSAQ
ncbi:hypothetical protein OAG68_01550 [bacterium]|nr:hypothetical protein [bacterium]